MTEIMVDVNQLPKVLIFVPVKRISSHPDCAPKQTVPACLVKFVGIPDVRHVQYLVRREKIRGIVVEIPAYTTIRVLPGCRHPQNLVAQIVPTAVATVKGAMRVLIEKCFQKSPEVVVLGQHGSVIPIHRMKGSVIFAPFKIAPLANLVIEQL